MHLVDFTIESYLFLFTLMCRRNRTLMCNGFNWLIIAAISLAFVNVYE